ncbi:hypothetical protein Q675_00975 [Labrenzia sp. C1B70]|nr:hypothetical protein Q675_00975 [Labrenzia sp. C1B70]
MTITTIGIMIAFAICPPEFLDELYIYEPDFFGPSIVDLG